jgi:hypothetical protein
MIKLKRSLATLPLADEEDVAPLKALRAAEIGAGDDPPPNKRWRKDIIAIGLRKGEEGGGA